MNDQNQNGYPNYNNQNYYNQQNGYGYNQGQMYQDNQYMNQNNMYYYPNQNMYYQNNGYNNYPNNIQYNQYPNYPQYSNNQTYPNYYNQQNQYNNLNNEQYINNNYQNNAYPSNVEASVNQNYMDQAQMVAQQLKSNVEDIKSNTKFYEDGIDLEENNNDTSDTYQNEKQEFKEVLEKVGINPNEFINEDKVNNNTEIDEAIDDKKVEQVAEIIKEEKVSPEKEQNKKTNKFSILNRYGEDLTEKEYITNPAIAREDEIRKLILVLLTPDKSACLVGKPGIGKTAIVEGLAYRILNNNVPNVLKGYKIIDVATSSLLGESVSDGERDSRIQLLVNEVMEADKIILFIDEIHTLMGAGAKEGSSLDFANILKPALARGNVKLIGATTSDEYERYMIRDRAFIRRFEKIDVAEPDIPTTVKILMGSYPRIEKKTGVKLPYTDYIKEKLMTFIVEMTSEYKRLYELSSRYPDISLALLSKAFSFAIFENSNYVKLKHFWLAINTCNSVYPDSRAKEVERFKEVFSDLIREEKLDVNAPIEID